MRNERRIRTVCILRDLMTQEIFFNKFTYPSLVSVLKVKVPQNWGI
jgi:hypothetical protein